MYSRRGVVNTGMGIADQDEPALQAVAAGVAMGTFVEATEIAWLVTFLATGACPSLTGSTIDINGVAYIR